jgi:NUMOD4 motif/HNH endonuclease
MITSLPNEVWKPVKDFPHYEVSNKGRIKSLARIDARGWRRKERIINGSNAEISLVNEEGKQWFAIASIVLSAFVGPKPKHCRLSRHLDDNRDNNRVENLAWGTDADNIDDAIKNGANFASYGHLGKQHSQKTREFLSKSKKGIPTGRKRSVAHAKAMLAGYRKKFPKKPIPKSKPCACGCGSFAAPGKTFVLGHHARVPGQCRHG